MLQEKKPLTLGKIQLKPTLGRTALPPKSLTMKPSESRPISAKQPTDYKSDIHYLLETTGTQFQEWCGKCQSVFKDWSIIADKNDQIRDSLLKQALILIDHNDMNIKISAIKASLLGFLTLNLSEILFNKQQKSILRRPKSGSKMQEQLPSLIYQPQQFMMVLQKTVTLSNDKQFNTLMNEHSISLILFKLFKLFAQFIKDVECCSQMLPYLVASFTILKNAANNPKEQQRILQSQYIQLIDGFLHTFPGNDKEIINLYSIITSTLRNLAIEISSTQVYLQNGIINKLVISMGQYASNYDLILNTLRIMSKMSLNKDCCEFFLKSEEAMKNVVYFFKSYQTNIYIIIRASYLLANMTTYFEGIRQLIYFKFNAFQDIFQCFDYYWNRELNPQNKMTMDQFGQSHAAWDFQILKKEKDVDALIRMIRLIANLLTIDSIGMDLLQNYQAIFKQLTSKLCKLLLKNTNISQQAEIISCTLGCLSNLTYYEKRTVINDFEFKNQKLELITLLGNYIVQNEDQEICCDGLRVLSNLSRQKDLIKHTMKCRVAEGVIVLLDSNSQEVVYYSLGVIINLLADQEFKNKENINILEPVLQIISDCTTDQNDIVNLCLRSLVLLLDSGLPQDKIRLIESAIMQFGYQCDQILKDQQIEGLQHSKQLINQIINYLPEEAYNCTHPNCGRRFKSNDELQMHITRRHKI